MAAGRDAAEHVADDQHDDDPQVRADDGQLGDGEARQGRGHQPHHEPQSAHRQLGGRAPVGGPLDGLQPGAQQAAADAPEHVAQEHPHHHQAHPRDVQPRVPEPIAQRRGGPHLVTGEAQQKAQCYAGDDDHAESAVSIADRRDGVRGTVASAVTSLMPLRRNADTCDSGPRGPSRPSRPPPRRTHVTIPLFNPYRLPSTPPPAVKLAMTREFLRRERRLPYAALGADAFIALIALSLGNAWILAVAGLRVAVDLLRRPSVKMAERALDRGATPRAVLRPRIPLYAALGFTWGMVMWPGYFGDVAPSHSAILTCIAVVAVVIVTTTVCYVGPLFTAACAGFTAGVVPVAFVVGGMPAVVGALAIPLLQVLLWDMARGTREQHVRMLEMQFEHDRLLTEQSSTIRELHVSRRHARELAATDSVTGLPNRQALLDHVDALVERGDATFALVLLGLDHFKNINDTMGHHIGDAVLVGMAEVLREMEDPGAGDDGTVTVARLGGDELALVLPGEQEPGELAARFQGWSRRFSQLPVSAPAPSPSAPRRAARCSPATATTAARSSTPPTWRCARRRRSNAAPTCSTGPS